LGILAWILALINLAFIPSMFFGPDATQFYSAVGWGTTATIPVLVVCWILVASVILIRTPEKSAAWHKFLKSNTFSEPALREFPELIWIVGEWRATLP
jgi:L-lactate permease